MCDSLQDKYNCLVEDVYKDILRNKGFRKKHGSFVMLESGVIKSVNFSGYSNGKDAIMVRINVEARLENEMQLRRENKKVGSGRYQRLIPDTPSWNKWTGKWKFSEEDLSLIQHLMIYKNTNLSEFKMMVEKLLDEALLEIMQFRTEENLIAFLNSEWEERRRTFFRERRKAIFREYFWYGVLGCCGCLIMKDLFPLAFLSVIYFIITCDIVSDAWVRRLFLVAVGQLLICIILFYLLTMRVIDSYAAGGLAIGLSLNGCCNITYSLYELYARGKKYKR